MIIRTSLVALAATFTFVATASADHRPRKHRYLSPPIEILTSAIDPFVDDEVWIDDEEDDEPTLQDMRDRRKKWSRVNDEPWWLDEEVDEDAAPAAKPVKKKAVTKAAKPLKAATLPPKPKAKPDKAAAAAGAKKNSVASKTAEPVTPKAQTAALTPKVSLPDTTKRPIELPKTVSTPKPSGKTVGCTGGAAIVTGLGFGGVRPRVCTGETYAYLASKSDGNYAIKLKATTGEVIDVAKLP